MIEMENLFYRGISQDFRETFIGDNLSKFKLAQPDTYEAMESLSNVTGLPIE